MKYIIGAYATAPSLGIKDKLVERIFYEKLKQSLPEMRGLEIPFWGKEIHRFGSEFLLDIINPDWDNVLSCIPGTMSFLAKTSNFGLASDDNNGREKAIAMHKRANNFLHRMNDLYGRKSIIAVQIVTAPSFPAKGVSSSLDSFLKSMDEILSWNWDNTKIVIEHCDASVSKQPFEKGFFDIENEIQALSRISSIYKVGITINWARSAIEGRSSDKPLEHLKLASKHKILSGLIFSGVSKSDEYYGDWKDTHMPFARSYNVEHYEKNSLLTLENITRSLECIDVEKLDYLGVKLLSMPINKPDISRRVGLNFDAISILDKILDKIKKSRVSN